MILVYDFTSNLDILHSQLRHCSIGNWIEEGQNPCQQHLHCECVCVSLCVCVCFNFLLSLKTFSFTCALLKSFFRRPLQQYFDAQPSQYIKRWCFDGLEMLWMSYCLVLIYRFRMICWYITRISEYIYNLMLIYYSNKFLCSDQIVCYTLQV